MLASPSLKPSAPSISLLRFLRSQSESVFFFTPNPTTSSSESSSTWHSSRSRHASAGRSASNWRNLNPAPCRAQLEASLFAFLSPTPSRKSTKSLARVRSPISLPITDVNIVASNILSRYASTKSRGWLRRLLDLRRVREVINDRNAAAQYSPSPYATTFTDEGAEGNLFNLGRTLATKINEPRLRCTEFDENGNVTLVNGEYRKSELIAKYGLLPRDLRKIDSSVLPHILVRPTAILISLLHLRVLIKADKVLVFDAYGSTNSYSQSVFMYDLEGKLRQSQTAGALAYEFRALEAVLISVTSGLEAEFEGVREPVVRVLRALEEDIDRDKLRHLLIYSKKLGSFEQKARLVRDAIEDLLEADDDLAAMYLSERRKGIVREESDHQEVEMLLESYHKVCDEIVQASGSLVTAIRNTEEVVRAILDANRNSLMLLDLKFSIATLGLAAGTLISSFYGMNLKNFIEESDFGFGAVSAFCFLSTLFVSMYGLMKLRKVQRVRMWAEGGVTSSGIAPLGSRHLGLGPPPPPGSPGGRIPGAWRPDPLDPILSGAQSDIRVERLRRMRDSSLVPAPTVPTSTLYPEAGRRSATSKAAASPYSKSSSKGTVRSDEAALVRA